ncbi:MAG TPA: AI-2E family transporter [Pyrinomonadaceae bacterium]
MNFRKDQTDSEAKSQEVKEVAETAAVAAAEASGPQTRVILRVITIILLVAAFIWVLYKLEGVLLLVVLSVFFSYLVAPLVELVRRPFKVRGRERVVPRAAAIGIVYLLIFGSIGLGIYLLAPRLGAQITQFAAKAPDYIERVQERGKGLEGFCQRNNIPPQACETINNTMKGAVERASKYAKEQLPGVVGVSIVEILGWIPWLILVPILSFFFLNDVESFRRSALQMFPRGRWRWRADEFFQDVNSTLAAYIRAQLTACLLIGTICTLGFIALGVPFSLVLGVTAGFFEFIPLVGPLVVAVVATLVASFSPDTSTYSGLWVLLFLGTLRIIHDYTIYPRLVGQGVHLHPVAVVLAILAGNELAGVAGIFLSIPLIAVATVSYRHWLEHRGSEGLVAEILQPAEETATEPATPEDIAPYYEDEVPDAPARPPRDGHPHPSADTTPDEMARARPDLTTGELKMPKV